MTNVTNLNSGNGQRIQKMLEYNLIKYKDLKNNILDIRKWDNSNDDKKMLKGITLTDDEARKLKDALNDYYKEA